MLFILLTILFITLISITFKVFPLYDIDAFQAIVVNYLICVLMSWGHSGIFPLNSQTVQAPWFYYAIGLSFCFIVGFYLQSVIFRIFGIAIASIVLKLSLLMTAIFSILHYQESLSISKMIGLFLALCAIVMVSYPKKKEIKTENSIGLSELSILLVSYLIAVLVDVGFIYIERSVSTESADPKFIGTATGFAFIWGCFRQGYRFWNESSMFEIKNVIAGVCLGIVNYLTFWGMLRSVATGIDPSVVFTAINIGVILIAALLGILFFKEKLSKINTLGIVTAVVAVFLIANLV